MTNISSYATKIILLALVNNFIVLEIFANMLEC